jgi:hypothetical protein
MRPLEDSTVDKLRKRTAAILRTFAELKPLTDHVGGRSRAGHSLAVSRQPSIRLRL